MELHDMNALITGAAGNLGQALARRFAAAGAKVLLVDRGRVRLGQLVDDLHAEFEPAVLEGFDLTDPAAVAELADKVRVEFGELHALVNAAGGFISGTPVHETPVETWDMMLDTNARTAFLTSRALIPLMLKSGGKIVNVAAGAGLKGWGTGAAYCASKAAVIRLTESLSDELKMRGVNVNCVLPSIIDTPENREAMPDQDFSKWVAPGRLADVILFLCSQQASAIHGAALPVSGLV